MAASRSPAAAEGWNELCFGVDGAKRPHAAHFGRIVDLHMLFLLADESPNLIHLQTGAAAGHAFLSHP